MLSEWHQSTEENFDDGRHLSVSELFLLFSVTCERGGPSTIPWQARLRWNVEPDGRCRHHVSNWQVVERKIRNQ
jgi:hypothetical protein